MKLSLGPVLFYWSRSKLLDFYAEMAALPIDAASREALCDECADVLLYLLLIAENAGIDLEAAARAKLVKNAAKYPADKAWGTSRKYDQLEG